MLNDDGEDVAEELIRSSASDVDDLIIGRGCALLRYTGRIDAAEAPFVCHDGVATWSQWRDRSGFAAHYACLAPLAAARAAAARTLMNPLAGAAAYRSGKS
jgi:hypothetical protein